MPPAAASAMQLRDAIARGELTAAAACETALSRIAARDPSLHAFLHVDAERALARAQALDRSPGPRGPLFGVPIALKDNISVRYLRATAGSRILERHVPIYDATVVERLEAAGAVIVGKTVCDEFAMGSSTEHSAFGPSRNPWDLDRIPGGSSGGSAVAVAAGMTPVALGSDTGGSIRQPAALCGVVGLKPTYGRVSRWGLIAFASSLDQIGPFARTVADAALVLDVIGGPDPRDSTATTRPLSPTLPSLASGEVRGRRIGVPRHLLGPEVDAEVTAAFDASLETLASQGAAIETVDLPHAKYSVPVYYLVATAEASSNLARYDGVRYGLRAADAASIDEMYDATRRAGFGAEVKRRIMLGTYVLSAGYHDAYYLKAQQVRTLIRRDFEAALARVDAVALPTSPTPAFPLGERTSDPVQMYLADVFTVGAPLAGLPAISVPCGLTRAGLPVGLQLIGRAWDEATLLQVAHAYESATSWSTMMPPDTTGAPGL
jgi:aspartyl-tRNA(Asn)/glutamyl-tRNA(Gln) amidotransferase subunit A